MIPRLVASDLDGTLLRSDRTLSVRTVRALRAASAAGMQVAFVTGRPTWWLPEVYAQLGAAGPAGPETGGTGSLTPSLPLAVCANGAMVYDPVADEVLRANPLSPELLSKLCHRLRRSLPDACFAIETMDGRSMLHESAYQVGTDLAHPAVRLVDSLAELTSVSAVKLLVRAGVRDPDEFTKLVAGCLDGLAEATHSSNTGLVEISAPGVTKAAGLAWLCDRLGIPAAEVVAFGDMPNDLPMLAWAGHAVAVGNAHPAVLAAADAVTATNEEDGVAAYLEKLA